MTIPKSKRVWTVADGRADLPEAPRRAKNEGPKYIGAAQTRGG